MFYRTSTLKVIEPSMDGLVSCIDANDLIIDKVFLKVKPQHNGLKL